MWFNFCFVLAIDDNCQLSRFDNSYIYAPEMNVAVFAAAAAATAVVVAFFNTLIHFIEQKKRIK